MILPESEPQTSHTASESFQGPSELVEKKKRSGAEWKCLENKLCIRTLRASPSKLCGSCTSQFYRDRSTPYLHTAQYQKYLHAYSSTRSSSDLHHVFTAQFLYSKIIVKIGINTPIFAHINVNAISPHLNQRFWGKRVDTCWDTRHSRYFLMLILGHQFVFVCPGLSPLVNDCSQ